MSFFDRVSNCTGETFAIAKGECILEEMLDELDISHYNRSGIGVKLFRSEG